MNMKFNGMCSKITTKSVFFNLSDSNSKVGRNKKEENKA